MQTGFYDAAGGMVAQFNRLNVISNNLANMNTNAFKRDDVIVGDFVRILKETRDELPIVNHSKDGAKFLNRSLTKTPRITEGFTDFESGGLAKTDNPLDFALTKENLFFLVLTPSGVKLTKDGSFNLDADGKVVTKDGFPVLSNEYANGAKAEDSFIQVPSNSRITTDKDGILNSIDTKGNTVPMYRFYLGKVENMSLLEKEGNNFYRLDKMNDLQMVENSGGLIQGYVEKSNINPVLEMTSLIETQRLMEMQQKVMKTHMDDLNSDAINKLAKSKT